MTAVVLTLSPAPFHAYVLPFNEAGGPQSFDESGFCARKCTIRRAAQNTDHPLRFLCVCCRDPRRGATEKRDEIATPHWPSPRCTTCEDVQKVKAPTLLLDGGL